MTKLMAVADEILGRAGNDTLRGESGDDVLYGNDGDDVLDGGVGNDRLIGGRGADTYIFGRGYGRDVIFRGDIGEIDTVQDFILMTSDVSVNDLTLSRIGNSLRIDIRNSLDQLQVSEFFSDNSQQPSLVSAIRFADGTSWNQQKINELVLVATLGNDQLYGFETNDVIAGLQGNDSIEGRAGNDTLLGGAGFDYLSGGDGNDTLDGGSDADSLQGGNGSDTYLFGRGSGKDYVINQDDDAVGTNLDRVLLGAGLSENDISLRRSGDALEIGIRGSSDTLTISSYFENDCQTSRVVEEIQFANGAVWTVATVKARVSQATSGNDSLFGSSSDDNIDALGGDDLLFGREGNDTLFGGDGDDYIFGDAGNDYIEGGAGNDLLYGGQGADTYVLRRGSNGDVVFNEDNDANGVNPDRVLVMNDITPDQVQLSRWDDDLIIAIRGTYDRMTIARFFVGEASSVWAVENIDFADGTRWNIEAVKAMVLVPTDGDDRIYGSDVNDSFSGGLGNDFLAGSAGNDVLHGGSGEDALYGGSGNDLLDGGADNDFMQGGDGADTYFFGRGSGQDFIDNLDNDQLGVNVDTLVLGLGIVAEDLLVSNSYSSLVISIKGTNDKIEIINYFQPDLGREYKIENIRFADGSVWTPATIDSLLGLAGTNGDDILSGTSADETIYGGYGNDTIRGEGGNDKVYGGAGDDILFGDGYSTTGSDYLDGGAGDDWMYGGHGNDVYFFDSGYGNDTILNEDFDISRQRIDILKFGSGIHSSDVVVTADGSHLVLSIANSSDSVRINQYFRDSRYQDYSFGHSGFNLNVVAFADGTQWTVQMIEQMALKPTQGNDVLNGYWTNDVIRGGEGNDWIAGWTGNDTLYGDAGNDFLNGEFGNDLLYGGIGDDTLYGEAGDDYLYGGDGNDKLEGGYGVNFLYGGQGNDSLYGGIDIDNLFGNEGNDLLVGGEGDDILTGGTGDDALNGMAGSDTFIFGIGDGHDRIVNTTSEEVLGGNVNTLLLGIGITPAGVTLQRVGDSLSVAISGTNDVIDIDSYFSTNAKFVAANYVIKFSDGTIWSKDSIAHILSPNRAPTLVVPLSGFTIEEDGVFNLLLPTGSFVDEDAGDTLTYSVKLANGNIKPSWLAVDAQTGALSGTAPLDASGLLQLTMVATDSKGASVSASLTIEILNTIRGTSANNNLSGTTARDVIYGLAGNDVIDGGAGADRLIGGAGNDTYVVDNVDDVVVELLGEGIDTVKSAVSFTLAANAENLTLTGSSSLIGIGNELANTLQANVIGSTLYGFAGNDKLSGGAGVDTLYGGDGLDTLDGGLGADVLVGGAGNDTYIVDNIADVVAELETDGTDLVKASVNYVLSANVENLTLIGDLALVGTGNELDNVITANAGNNVLYGLGGNDKLLGSSGVDQLFGGDGNDTLDGGVGADVLTGGAGNDTYLVDDNSDMLVELAGEGTDTVQSTVSFYLADDFENLTLIGTANINGIGNAANNILKGNAGVNSLAGGAGNDTYVVSIAMTTVVELVGEGVDTVQSSVDFSLSTEVENLTLTGTAQVGAGNGLANSLVGNASANTLYGLAGNDKLDGKAGDDVLVGGTGDDIYTIDSSLDMVVELAGEGTDSVTAYANYVLPEHVENLTLAGIGLAGYGNAGANVLSGKAGSNDTLYGFAGNDTLRGFGGADILDGGIGDDNYQLLTAGDAAQVIVIEQANAGIDTVTTIEDYQLTANVENGVLAANATGTKLTGNASANSLIGNAAVNSLIGGAGDDVLNGMAGADLLYGGSGNDTYVVDNIADAIGEDAANGTDSVQSSVTYALQENVENLTLTGTGTINGFGNSLSNTLNGNAKNNLLFGFEGTDTIFGDAGNDNIDGGADGDFLYGGDGVDLIAGGSGNDLITSGSGADVLIFNRGHGTDVIYGNNVREDVISLSGIRYADLSLSRSGNDLILSTGGTLAPSDSIKFSDWYAGAMPSQTSVAKLQMFTEGTDYNSTGSKIVNRKIEQFDFAKLVLAFETATTSSNNSSKWAISTTTLSNAYLSASDTVALGGASTIDYARNGVFATSAPQLITPPPLNASAPVGQIFGGF
jgi:Ca2+-binding RTX toxin-like protein